MPRSLLILLLVWLGSCSDLHAAYIDPASSSTFLQILAPVFMTVVLFGGYLKRGFLKLFRRGQTSSEIRKKDYFN